MRKNKYREPSNYTFLNDRSIHLGNTQNHLRSIEIMVQKFNKHGVDGITNRDTYKLLELSDKCSRTLKKYLNPRNFMNKGQMLQEIDKEFSSTPSYTTFDHELAWLGRFGKSYVTSGEKFVESDAKIIPKSTQDFYRFIIKFREEFGRMYAFDNTDFEVLRENFGEYLDKVLQIAGGTGLVCDDGLRYYKPSSSFSARSIWLGSGMFLEGAKNLLQMQGS